MERGLIMLIHSVILGVLLYVLMIFALGQSAKVAEDRSVFLGAIILIYMVLFGHKLPGSVNKNIL